MKRKMLIFAILGLLLCLDTIPALAQDIAGDWMGTLTAGATELRMAMHISKGDDGSLKATIDVIDQNAFGIPGSSISVQDSKITLALDAIQVRYEGVLNSSETGIEGTWAQGGQLFPLRFNRQAAEPETKSRSVTPSDIDGTWMGSLDMGSIKQRIVFHISNTPDGLSATADNPDQNVSGISVSSVTHNGATLTLEMKSVATAFSGTINQDLTAIEGTFTFSGASIPLVLKRVKNLAELELRRPQNPTRPYPYIEEEVTYNNSAAGIQLAATLTIPKGSGPFPAVVLITGSGAQDRDSNMLGHKPFLVLADHLTRNGIIVLRFDDRGVGKSGGDFVSATTADFATDVDAGVVFLKTRRKVDTHKIGLIGLSEGGIIAPMVAAGNEDIAFIIMMAGTGVPGYKVLVEQTRLLSEASGVRGEALNAIVAAQRETMTLLHEEKDAEKRKKALSEIMARIGKPEGQIQAEIMAMETPWYRFFLEYDPATALEKVRCPVLALNGEKDTQVSPEQNLPAIQSALEAGGNTSFTVVELKGLNHIFQHAGTGSPREYGEIDETIAPVALNMISDWILEQSRK